jgi:hypothetical protein
MLEKIQKIIEDLEKKRIDGYPLKVTTENVFDYYIANICIPMGYSTDYNDVLLRLSGEMELYIQLLYFKTASVMINKIGQQKAVKREDYGIELFLVNKFEEKAEEFLKIYGRYQNLN